MTREGPKELPRVRFGQIAEFRNGLNFDASATGQSVKVAGVGSFLQRSRLDDFSDAAIVTVRGEVPQESLLRDGDLLFVRSNGSKDLVGRCAMVFPGNERVAFSGFTIRARVTRDDVDSSYLLAVARSELFRRELHEKGAGSSITNLSQELLSEVEVPLPDLATQRRIATALRTWDDAIDRTERLIAAKRASYDAEQRQALAPAFTQATNWTQRLLGWAFAERVEHDPTLPLASITAADGVIDRELVDRRDTSPEDKSSYKVIRPGDIGYNTMRMWQGVSGLSNLDAIVSPAYTVIVPVPNRVDAEFAAHLFKEPKMINRLWRYSQGLVDDTLQLKFRHFAEIEVALPKIEEQKRIAFRLSAGRVELDLLNRVAARLQLQKRGLMQKLLTGEHQLRASMSEAAA